MSSSVVIHGKVNKGKSTRTRKPTASNQLVKYVTETQLQVQPLVPPGRARPIKGLEEYDEVIKYLYLSLGYTLEKLHEAMETIFRIGATVKQYGSYIDRAKLNKKKLTTEEWENIIPYFYACKLSNGAREMAVSINGLYTLEPSVVEREVRRRTSAHEESTFLRGQTQSMSDIYHPQALKYVRTLFHTLIGNY
ncbi:hypothetical protein TWF718_005985 [Orbilia javanica]|uniref:Clr5 domain-containing protein n=1 Tax=Orbilia javanica TaxID=47235 RepID=A0AAN8MZT0_9PEZI